MTDDTDDPVTVPNEVYSQLEATRESGDYNMITEIKLGLRELGFDEAYDWVTSHPEQYMDGAMNRGFQPEDDDDDD